MKCKYKKTCKYYREDSYTCNHKQSEGGKVYCGIGRKLAGKKLK